MKTVYALKAFQNLEFQNFLDPQNIHPGLTDRSIEVVKILKIFLQTCYHTLNPFLFARMDGH